MLHCINNQQLAVGLAHEVHNYFRVVTADNIQCNVTKP